MKAPRLGPGSTMIVDRDEGESRILGRWMERAGHSVAVASSPAQCRVALEETVPDILFLELGPRTDEGLELIREVRVRLPRVAIVVITENARIPVVVTATQAGANDCLVKPLEEHRLLIVAKNAIAFQRLNSRVASLEREARGQGFGEIVGRSPEMKLVFGQLARVADSDITVLIQGESGVGKELVARAIHDSSPRQRGPFIAINCAAIPESLQESELFGHEKGAFTGAVQRRIGRFEQANGGTLFFDEVAELSPPLQAKLLRVLQEKTFSRVGGRETLSTDVRVLTATHRNLSDEVRTGCFREDLYYRIAVMELHVPPLRARDGDIAMLAQMFLEEFDEALGRQGGTRGFELDALQAIMGYGWPGNVRELQNAMQRASVLADGSLVQLDDLPQAIASAAPSESGEALASAWTPPSNPDSRASESDLLTSGLANESRSGTAATAGSGDIFHGAMFGLRIPAGVTLQDIEEEAVRASMERSRGNISSAARELGVSRSVMYRKLDRFGLRSDG